MAPHNQQDQVLSTKGWSRGGEERGRGKVGKEGGKASPGKGRGARKEKDEQGKGKRKKILPIPSAPPLRRATIQTLQCKSLIYLCLLSFTSPFAYNNPPFTHQSMLKHLPSTTENYGVIDIEEK